MKGIEWVPLVLNLVFGLIAIAAGILTIRFREPLNRSIFNMQETMFGRRVAKMSAGRQTPAMLGVVGGFFVIFGALMIAAGVMGALGARG